MVTHPNPNPSPLAIKRNTKDQINSPFLVYHQNIRGLYNKSTELLGSITPNLPHVLCLTEHHCKEHASLPIKNYPLAANFCRLKMKKGGTCIFVHESHPFSTIDLKKIRPRTRHCSKCHKHNLTLHQNSDNLHLHITNR